jgi:membrane protein DedA with SNARE-associated domain
MDFKTYTLMTLAGSAAWCAVLAWFGAEVIGDRPELLNDPQQMIQVLTQRFHWFVGLILLLTVLYILVMRLTAKPEPARPNPE